MNDIIKEQLKKVRWVALPDYDDNTTQMIIKKQGKPTLEFNVGHFYIFEIADYILTPSDTFTLASNWNKGIIPQSKYIRCQILQIMGKMIRVGAIGYDLSNQTDKSDIYESLWLPKAGIKIIDYLGA